jgi:hypothetical protein
MSQSDRDIIEKLLNGWTLKTLMEPDSDIASNGPSHLENLTLQGVILKENIFWGYTLHHHLNISSIDYFLLGGDFKIGTFLYTNMGGKEFFSYVMEDMVTNSYQQILFPISRYYSHRWVLVDDYVEIFSSRQDDGKEKVREAIRRNDDLKCAFLDDDDYTHISQIHIPYFVYDSGKIYLQSEALKMQPMLLSPQWIEMVQSDGQIIKAIRVEKGGERRGVVLDGPVAHAQSVIDLDGFYTDMGSQLKRNWLQAKEIKVFKRKLPEDVKKIVF